MKLKNRKPIKQQFILDLIYGGIAAIVIITVIYQSLK